MVYKEVILVTGGLGFIGSHFIEILLEKGHRVINIDKITYASNLEIGEEFIKKYPEQYEFIQKDINDLEELPFCDFIVHFAAESHVDNSIKDSSPFIKSNINGTHNLLQLLLRPRIANAAHAWLIETPTFIYISTDEVLGDTHDGFHKEGEVLSPSNPYSASKAAAEYLIKSWSRTFGIKYKITRTTNNYGPRQHPEKLIPNSITRVLTGQKIQIHGHGDYIRNWVHVIDNCNAIYKVMKEGAINETYHVSSDEEYSNNQIAKMILQKLGKPFSKDHVKYIQNRSGQDVRYALDNQKLKKLGWIQKHKFFDVLDEIINFYKQRLGGDRFEKDSFVQGFYARER